MTGAGRAPSGAAFACRGAHGGPGIWSEPWAGPSPAAWRIASETERPRLLSHRAGSAAQLPESPTAAPCGVRKTAGEQGADGRGVGRGPWPSAQAVLLGAGEASLHGSRPPASASIFRSLLCSWEVTGGGMSSPVSAGGGGSGCRRLHSGPVLRTPCCFDHRLRAGETGLGGPLVGTPARRGGWPPLLPGSWGSGAPGGAARGLAPPSWPCGWVASSL